MFILKILFAPLSLILSLFVWLCRDLAGPVKIYAQIYLQAPAE